MNNEMTEKEIFTMNTKEELNALKEEVETVSKKLHELTEEELEQVSGGYMKVQVEPSFPPYNG